jgi:hypothetical protein
VNSSTYVKQPCAPAADCDDGASGPRRRQSAVAIGQLFEDEQGFVAPLTGDIAGSWCAVFHFGPAWKNCQMALDPHGH